MPKNNAQYLAEFPAESANKFVAFINEVESRTSYKVLITDGVRTYAQQAELHKKNPSNAKPGTSKHEKKNAIDLNLTKGGVITHRKATSKAEWEKTGVPAIAREMGFRWGGDFKSYHDPVHFEISSFADKVYEGVKKNPVPVILILVTCGIIAAVIFSNNNLNS